VSSVLHINLEYNGDQHSGNPYYERSDGSVNCSLNFHKHYLLRAVRFYS
jgi:hypothetical protein